MSKKILDTAHRLLYHTVDTPGLSGNILTYAGFGRFVSDKLYWK